jgi:hypothetical protein
LSAFRIGAAYIKDGRRKIPKKVLIGNFHNTRPVGRPRTRWADVVQRDAVQLLGIREWRKAANRDEWRHLVREAGFGSSGVISMHCHLVCVLGGEFYFVEVIFVFI